MSLTVSDLSLYGAVICAAALAGVLIGALVAAALIRPRTPLYHETPEAWTVPEAARPRCCWCAGPLPHDAAVAVCNACIRERLTPPVGPDPFADLPPNPGPFPGAPGSY